MLICDICPRLCELEEGETGFCNVRKNENGENVDSLYGLFYPNPEGHNPPGSYTIVFPGCNLKCWFCNDPFVSVGFTGDTSQWPTGTYRKLSPREFAEKARKSAGPSRGGFACGMAGLFGGEPTIHFEYIIEASRICHELGCITKLHTSGYVSEQVMRDLSRVVDVISINVKGSASPSCYERMRANPTHVLRSIKIAWETPRPNSESHSVKATKLRNLVGPGFEPTYEESVRFAEYIVKELDPFVEIMVEPASDPVNRFIDKAKEHLQPMSGESVDEFGKRAVAVGQALWEGGLENVFVGGPATGPLGGVFHIPTRQVRAATL